MSEKKQDKPDLPYDKMMESFSGRVNDLLGEFEERTGRFNGYYSTPLTPGAEEYFSQKVQRQIRKAELSLSQAIKHLDRAQVLSRGADLHVYRSPQAPVDINGNPFDTLA